MDCLAPISLFRASLPSKYLYQAPNGGSVILDLQGQWNLKFFGVLPFEASGEIDERLWRGGDCQIRESAWLASSTDDSRRGWAAWSSEFGGCPEIQEISWNPASLNQAGTGWLLAEDCEVEINCSARPIDVPSWAGTVPIPFWDGYQSSKPVRWIESRATKTLLADIEIGSPGGWQDFDFKIDRASAIEQSSWLDGRGEPKSGTFLSHLGRASMSLTVPSGTKCLALRRTFDAFHGLQRARLLLNGRMAGWWHQTLQDRQNRWSRDDCILSLGPDFAGGKTSLIIEPPAGSPLFSLGRLEIWAATW